MTSTTAIANINSESSHIGVNKWLRVYSKLVCFSVVLLIFKGALVTSHDAGLSVPDWPTSYGDNMFLFPPSKWTGIIFFEHVHRLLASFVGFLTLILTVWILLVEKRTWVKVLSICALFTVILQGILGGLTVLFLLPTAVSSGHAVLAQTFFILTIVIAYSQSQELIYRNNAKTNTGYTKLFKIAIIFVVLIYLQLILGAIMRHSSAGLAVPDFPTMGGQWLPQFDSQMFEVINNARSQIHLGAVTSAQVIIHLLHRLGAVLILIFGSFLFMSLKRSGALNATNPIFYRTNRISFFIFFILALQFLMGIYTVLSSRDPWIASFHVAIGAILLGCSVLLAIRLHPLTR